MQIEVLFFAAFRELAGTDRRTVSLPPDAVAGTLIPSLRDLDRRFEALPDRVAVVVNQRVVDMDHPIREGDEVALLPPVAGG